MKTSELTGAKLDWAVATALGATDFWYDTIATYWMKLDGKDIALGSSSWAQRFAPSTDWAHGGPITEREGIQLHVNEAHTEWLASCWGYPSQQYGPTPLIAAMRCFVASKLGDEVEVPNELR